MPGQRRVPTRTRLDEEERQQLYAWGARLVGTRGSRRVRRLRRLRAEACQRWAEEMGCGPRWNWKRLTWRSASGAAEACAGAAAERGLGLSVADLLIELGNEDGPAAEVGPPPGPSLPQPTTSAAGLTRRS